MWQELVAVEQSTALAIKDNSLGERTAALQLQDAHWELAAAHEVRDKFSILRHEQLCTCLHVLCMTGGEGCLRVLKTGSLLGQGHSH